MSECDSCSTEQTASEPWSLVEHFKDCDNLFMATFFINFLSASFVIFRLVHFFRSHSIVTRTPTRWGNWIKIISASIVGSKISMTLLSDACAQIVRIICSGIFILGHWSPFYVPGARTISTRHVQCSCLTTHRVCCTLYMFDMFRCVLGFRDYCFSIVRIRQLVR